MLALGCGSYVSAPDGSGGSEGLGGAGGTIDAAGGQESTGGSESGGADSSSGGAEASGGQMASGGVRPETGGEPGSGGAAASGGSIGTGGTVTEPTVLWSAGHDGSVLHEQNTEWVSASINWDDDNCDTDAAVPILPGDTVDLQIQLGPEDLGCIGDPGAVPVMHFGPQDWILADGPSEIDTSDPTLRVRFVVESFACESSPTKHCTAEFRWELLRD